MNGPGPGRELAAHWQNPLVMSSHYLARTTPKREQGLTHIGQITIFRASSGTGAAELRKCADSRPWLDLETDEDALHSDRPGVAYPFCTCRGC
jgi:hypothetical protein